MRAKGKPGRVAVKVVFNPEDPFDAEVMDELLRQTNRAQWLRMTAFCYVKGLAGPACPEASGQPLVRSEKDRLLNAKLERLVESPGSDK